MMYKYNCMEYYPDNSSLTKEFASKGEAMEFFNCEYCGVPDARCRGPVLVLNPPSQAIYKDFTGVCSQIDNLTEKRDTMIWDAYELFKETSLFEPDSKECDHSIETAKRVISRIDEVSNDWIYFSGEESWAYGGYDKWTVQMPTRYIYDLDYREEIRLKDEKAKKDAEDKISEQAKWAAMAQEEKERREYARLKEKFEGQ